jgi:hypothetical protein
MAEGRTKATRAAAAMNGRKTTRRREAGVLKKFATKHVLVAHQSHASVGKWQQWAMNKKMVYPLAATGLNIAYCCNFQGQWPEISRFISVQL